MVTQSSIIPLLVVALPLLGAGVVAYSARWGSAVRAGVANLLTFGTVLLTVWQFLLVQSGRVLVYTLDWYVGFGLYWRVDFLSAVFAVIVALVWLLSTLFAVEYMAHEHQQTRFFVASIFTLGSTLGVFLAGDLLSLFLFFELMTFAAYLLVIHEENTDALRAGNVYLFMSVIGGLFLLGSIFFIQHTVGNTAYAPVLEQLVAAGLNPWWLFVVVLLGFGVKAGMLPLHIWLPKAHPVAPAPASALLSALMIKTGAYGFLRFFYVLLTVAPDSRLFFLQEAFGYAFIWIGAITMLGGALMALIHTPMKRILAYSSISQMGYILFSLGVGVMLGPDGAWGLAGAWMHMINHAFFKSFLFLLAGAVYLQTGELDLTKLGGLKRHMPVALGFFLVAAGGITGVPGFNGYVSKILIHEGILHAFELKGWSSLLWLERVFVFTGGLTAAYISKIWIKTFFGKPKQDWSQVQDLSAGQRGIFGVYTFILLGIGLAAQTRVNQLTLPALGITEFNPLDLEHLGQVPFWSLHELQGPLLSYGIAGATLLFQALFGRYFTVPRWLSVEFLVYQPLYRGARGFFNLLGAWGLGIQATFARLNTLRKAKQKPKRTRTWSGTWSLANWLTNRTNLLFDTVVIVIVLLAVVVLIFVR